MTRTETLKIITLLAGNYDAIANKSQKQKELMLNTWYECLNDLDYIVVLNATKKAIIDSSYVPTIHDIREKAMEFINPTSRRTGIEAWQEAYQMIKNGTYMTREDFDIHSPEVKKFFGSVENLRSYSTNTCFNIDVVRSNFLKQYDVIILREKQDKILPNKMQQMIGNLSEKLSLNKGE